MCFVVLCSHVVTWRNMTRQDMTWHDIIFHDIVLHHITLHHITSHYITLHNITLHYITSCTKVIEDINSRSSCLRSEYLSSCSCMFTTLILPPPPNTWVRCVRRMKFHKRTQSRLTKAFYFIFNKSTVIMATCVCTYVKLKEEVVYENASVNLDWVRLWNVIRQTHLTHVFRGGGQMRVVNMQEQELRYSDFKQG